jgi:hypothetical protein
MKRGEVARRLISEGEDPFRMFAAVVWPGRDWMRCARDWLHARRASVTDAVSAGALGSSASRGTSG